MMDERLWGGAREAQYLLPHTGAPSCTKFRKLIQEPRLTIARTGSSVLCARTDAFRAAWPRIYPAGARLIRAEDQNRLICS